MSDGTPIEWTDATWNPVSGCTKVSQGCKNCYAERLWPKVAGAESVRTGRPPRPFTEVRCHPDRLAVPLDWRRPRRIFVNSMSDLFHEDAPFAFVDRVFAVMGMARRHSFQVLTKRPERMLEYLTDPQRAAFIGAAQFVMASENPRMLVDGYTGLQHTRLPFENVWLGVSVEDQVTADHRIPLLLRTPAALRFVSAEPLLGPVDITRISTGRGRAIDATSCDYIDTIVGNILAGPPSGMGPIDWIIAGGESGPNARPTHPDWIRSLRDQCAAAPIAFLFKQWGNWAPVKSAEVSDQPFGWRPVHGVKPNGEHLIHTEIYDPTIIPFPKGMYWMERVANKKKAGRSLDGREHTEFPADADCPF